jgi:O-antigen/teichoic acid export membrane protein
VFGGVRADGGCGVIAAEINARAAPRIYRPVLRAMSQCGACALASGLLSALATKIIAAVGGPAALATLSTLQQLRQAAVVAATANGQTALVRGASGLGGRERSEYVRTVACVFAAATALVAGSMILWPQPLAALAGFGSDASRLIPWLAIPVGLTSLLVFVSALLNALGAIGRLAILLVIASGAMALGAWPAAQAFAGGKRSALVVLLIFSAAVSGIAALIALVGFRRPLEEWFRGPGQWWSGPAVRSFGATSAALLVSGLAASGALLAVRRHIVLTQGLTVTGQFDAAWGLSMNQVTLVLSTLQTYYLPAVARSRSHAERDGHIASVLMVAALTAAGAIAGIALLKPWLLRMFYSAAFEPASAYLRWTLLGDYLKVTSWILSIPILAAADMKMFLVADLAAYGVFVAVAAGLAPAVTAASGAAIGFVVMYAVHLILCAIYLWRKLRFVPTRGALAAWVLGLSVVSAVSALNWDQT